MFLVARGVIEPPTQGFSRPGPTARASRAACSNRHGSRLDQAFFTRWRRSQAWPDSWRESAQNEFRRLRWRVPVWKVTASLEPMHAGIRKQFQSALGFSGKAHPVLFSASNDKRVRDRVSWCALLLFTICKLVQQFVKSGGGDITAQLIPSSSSQNLARAIVGISVLVDGVLASADDSTIPDGFFAEVDLFMVFSGCDGG